MQPTDIARQAYAAFSAADMDVLVGLLAPDTVWHINDVKPLNGDYTGVQGVLGFLGRLLKESGGTFVIEVREFMGNNTHAAMLIHQTAQRNGKALASPAVHVIRVDEGKIAEFWASSSDPATDTFWS